MPTVPAEFHYYLPAVLSLEHFAREHLSGSEYTREDPEHPRRWTFWDTFDWRLHSKGLALLNRAEGDEPLILLRTLGTGRELTRVSASLPRFVRDVGDTALRELLEPVIEMRAVLPVVTVRSARLVFARRNRSGKMVARIFLEENAVVSGDGKRGPLLAPRVVLSPLKGYQKACEKFSRFFEDDLALRSAPDILDEAMKTLGIGARHYHPKPKVPVTDGMPAWLAARKILLELLRVMEQNEQGAREDTDSEFLHDFRVAVRSTRAIMRQMKEVFPWDSIIRFQPEFSWLGTVTGPTRDLDVYLLRFDDFRHLVPSEHRGHLEPLRGFLAELQRKEQRLLAEKLASRRYRRLTEDWRSFLESEGDADTLPPAAAAQVGGLVRRRIWKLFRKTVRGGQAITETSPPADLHELRKTCKKLRYMMEFFRSLFPPHEIAGMIKSLKGLQECLGDFQDFQVHKEALAGYRDSMDTEMHSPAETLLAISVLIDRLERQQQKARSRFSARFETFTTPKNRRNAKRLFSSGILNRPGKQEQ